MHTEATCSTNGQNLFVARTLAEEVLGQVMRYRRFPHDAERCANQECKPCVAHHVDLVSRFISRNEPIRFVLPAFPGKSPNPAKVLGTRPDMAERQSLTFLNGLCQRIQKIYEPGAQIVLCSDGRVFNDVVGITENDISTYHQDLLGMIESLKAQHLTTFNLDDVMQGYNYEEMRSELVLGFGDSIDALRLEVGKKGEAHRLYCGITRFLFEDGLRPQMKLSKTALQKQCRQRAYEVIQRSRAWDGLLAKYFPEAIRLSIHPQVCGSRKIGIHLMETEDEWLTAWHSVAVERNGQFRLMKRSEAEAMGAELVFQDGRPSHFVMAETGGKA